MHTTAQLIDQYIKIRDHIKELEAQFEVKIAPFRDGLKSIEAAVTEELNKQGGQSIKTEAGTAYRTTVMQARVESREDFLDFVFDGRREGFLTNAVSKEAVKEYLDMHSQTPPPGVQVALIHKTNFRRS